MAPFNRLDYFLHEHDTNRWNLQDVNEALQLYDTLRTIANRYYALSQLQHIDHQYANAHGTFGMYWAMSKVQLIIFPMKGDRREWASLLLNKANRELDVLEEKLDLQGFW